MLLLICEFNKKLRLNANLAADMLRRVFWCVLLLVFVFPFTGIGQADNGAWTTFRLRKQITQKTRVDFRPIIRFNNDVSDYQNWSIDIVVNHKLSKRWSVQFLSRTWFLPNSPEGQFLWADITHQANTKFFSIINTLRYHGSLDTNEINPADFVRFQTRIVPFVNWKVKPFFMAEPWYQLGEKDAYTRFRIEGGFNIKLDGLNNFTFLYRRQNSIDRVPSNHQNHYVLTLTRKL